MGAHYVLESPVSHNRLLRPHLFAMRVFGYAIFDHQWVGWAHNARGILLSVLFVVFNVTQVRQCQPAANRTYHPHSHNSFST